MEPLRTTALIVATMTIGLMSGVFGLYAHTIMRGLGDTDDRTFVGAFQAIDRAIINPWFLASFIGALAFTAIAAALQLGKDERSALRWIAAALILYIAVFAITIGVNVPLNDELKAAGEPDRIADLAAARERFDEARWVRWNVVRTVACTVAFGCLSWALVLHGRAEDGA